MRLLIFISCLITSAFCKSHSHIGNKIPIQNKDLKQRQEEGHGKLILPPGYNKLVVPTLFYVDGSNWPVDVYIAIFLRSVHEVDETNEVT